MEYRKVEGDSSLKRKEHSDLSLRPMIRLQTDRDNPAEYGFIRKRKVPFGMIRIAYQTIRFRLIQNRIWILRFRFKP